MTIIIKPEEMKYIKRIDYYTLQVAEDCPNDLKENLQKTVDLLNDESRLMK